MAEPQFAIAEYEAEMSVEYTLQALAQRHDVDARRREADADIDIDPWRPLFEGE